MYIVTTSYMSYLEKFLNQNYRLITIKHKKYFLKITESKGKNLRVFTTTLLCDK